MNVFAAVLALQVQQLHHHFAGVAVVNFSLQQNDPVFQQQIAQRQHSLPLIIAVVQPWIDRRRTRLVLRALEFHALILAINRSLLPTRPPECLLANIIGARALRVGVRLRPHVWPREWLPRLLRRRPLRPPLPSPATAACTLHP